MDSAYVGPPPAGGPHARLSVREQLALSCYWFSLNFQNSALLPLGIPAQILLFVSTGQAGNAQQAAAVGALSALAAVIALILQPSIGAISDYTPGRLGRRRPYVIVFSLVLAAGSLGLAFAGNAAAFLLAFIVVQIGNNGATAAYQALIPDRVPAEQRGAASGYMGLMNILGNVGSLALAGALLSSKACWCSTRKKAKSVWSTARPSRASHKSCGCRVLLCCASMVRLGNRKNQILSQLA